jgi:hypothetical protein
MAEHNVVDSSSPDFPSQGYPTANWKAREDVMTRLE